MTDLKLEELSEFYLAEMKDIIIALSLQVAINMFFKIARERRTK